MKRPKNITLVILPEEEAKEASVRRTLRRIGRDCWFLLRGLGRHWKQYCRVWSRGAMYKNHWWLQHRG